MKQKKLYISDVTNRDGIRGSSVSLSKLQKTMINLYLNEMGIFSCELGFPALPHEKNYINANLELVDKGVLTPIALTGWCPARHNLLEDILRTTYLRNICFSFPVSDKAIELTGEKDGRSFILKEVRSMVQTSKENGIKSIVVSAHDASRADQGFLLEFARTVKESGGDRIRYCDSIGRECPSSIYDNICVLAKEVDLPVELHCHNDLGMAVANSLAGAFGAIDSGVDAFINTTVNGYGERAGNCDLLAVILAVKYALRLEEMNILDPRVDTKAAWKTAKYTASAFGLAIPANQVGIGRHVFEREDRLFPGSEIGDILNYDLYSYEELGLGEPELIETGITLIAGEYSESQSFKPIFEKLGYVFDSDGDAKEIYELCQYATIHNQTALTADELLFIASNPEQARKIITTIP